ECAADDRVAPVEATPDVEQVHRPAAAAAAAFALAEHLGHHRCGRHAACQRMAVLAVGGEDAVVVAQLRHRAGSDRLLADVQVQEAANAAGAVELGAFLLEAPDAHHLPQQSARVVALGRHVDSSVDVSPSGSPSSRALSRRRMILPLRVLGRFGTKSISLGATAAPRRLRAKPSSSRFSASPGSMPGLSATNALTISPITGSGFPITPASCTAG